MSDELSRIWRMRLAATQADVAGLKLQMRWVLSQLAPSITGPTPSSPPFSSSPTGSPQKTWLQRIAASAFEKLGREALTQFALWLLGLAIKWVAPWLLAWWAAGGSIWRFLRHYAPYLFG